MPVKAIIVDDEPLAREIVKRFLASHPEILIVQECGDGFEALKAIQQHQPGLLFLDIQMPKLEGFELLEVLPQKPEIIFTTAYDQFAIRAFEMNAVDYLLKPYSKERFDTAVSKALLRISQGLNQQADHVGQLQKHLDSASGLIERVVTRLGSRVTVIPVDNIWYVEAQDDYVMVYSELGKHLKEKTMKFFEEHLPSNSFIRIHRGYIINISQITAVDQYTRDTHMVTLRCGAKLRVSEEGYKRLRACL